MSSDKVEFNSPYLSDVEIVLVKDDPARVGQKHTRDEELARFHAHRQILVQKSEYFDSCSKYSSSEYVLYVDEEDVEAFKHLMYFVYEDQFVNSQVIRQLHLAKKIMLCKKVLQFESFVYAARNITKDDVFVFYDKNILAGKMIDTKMEMAIASVFPGRLLMEDESDFLRLPFRAVKVWAADKDNNHANYRLLFTHRWLTIGRGISSSPEEVEELRACIEIYSLTDGFFMSLSKFPWMQVTEEQQAMIAYSLSVGYVKNDILRALGLPWIYTVGGLARPSRESVTIPAKRASTTILLGFTITTSYDPEEQIHRFVFTIPGDIIPAVVQFEYDNIMTLVAVSGKSSMVWIEDDDTEKPKESFELTFKYRVTD